MSRNAKPNSPPLERRRTARQPTELLAFALHANGARFPCQVRNISDRGAMLEFLGSHVTVLDNAFDLVLADAKVRYAVKVVWRKDRTAGVVFSTEE